MRLIKIYILTLSLLSCISSLYAQNSVLPTLIDTKHNDSVLADDDKQVETKLKQKMFVKIFTNKNKIFVGEPLMATYKFYASMSVSDQPTVTKQPEFTGCSVKELNFEQGPDFENINNETYAVYTIRKVQVTPLQEGALSLGQAVVDNFVQLNNPDDPFVTKRYTVEVTNAAMNVDVIALPEKDKPQNFNGIAGTFKITAVLKDKKIPVGENGHLIITIRGAGNLDAINKPDIKWPANVDHFDGTDSQHIDQNSFPLSGERVFDIPFIGKKEGNETIPPLTFSFFNADSKTYQTTSTDSIALTFTKALSKKEEFTNVVNYDISNRKYLWIVGAIAIVVVTIGFVSYKRNKKQNLKKDVVVSTTPAPAFVQPQPVYTVKFRTDFSRYLSELETVTESKPFFSKAKEILIKAVAERVDSSQYEEQVLLSELKQRTYNAPVCAKVASLLEAININLYAPYEIEADTAFYFSELKHMIEELQAEG